MHEVIEGLPGIADDFIVVGFGDTDEQAVESHDANLEVFLKRCKEHNLRLNSAKKRLRLPEVPFIGHIATAQGLQVDPHKVQAIVDMPTPEDVAAMQRILGFVQYLSKFMPHLSDMTKPLRDLTQKDNAWTWGPNQQAALEELKKAIADTLFCGTTM